MFSVSLLEAAPDTFTPLQPTSKYANTGSILRVWHQQKVLTTAMKGLLNPSTILIEMLLPLLLFAHIHARSGPSNKALISPGKKQSRPRWERAHV